VANIPRRDSIDTEMDMAVTAARAEFQSAKLRADEAVNLAETIRGEMWSRQDHEDFRKEASEYNRKVLRRLYVLFVFGALLIVVAFVLIVTLVRTQNMTESVVRADLETLAGLAVTSCEARNTATAEQEQIYRDIAANIADNPNSRVLYDRLIAAADAFPEPVDCAEYDRLRINLNQKIDEQSHEGGESHVG